MRYTVTGEILQLANVRLEVGESFRSVPGAMAYATGNMRMEAADRGGILKALGKSLSGGDVKQVQYSPEGGVGMVGLGGSYPGRIFDMDIGKGRWILSRGAYLGSQPSVSIEAAFKKDLGEKTFGRDGFSLLDLSGSGIALACTCGDFSMIDLKDGETYIVSAASALAWTGSVEYRIASAGVKSDRHGGDKAYVVELTGPGRIAMQSMSPSGLAWSMAEFRTRDEK